MLDQASVSDTQASLLEAKYLIIKEYRILYTKRPKEFAFELAHELSQLADMLAESGRLDEALVAIGEAAGLYQSLLRVPIIDDDKVARESIHSVSTDVGGHSTDHHHQGDYISGIDTLITCIDDFPKLAELEGEIAGPSALSDALSPAPELGAPTDHTTTYHIKRQLNEDTSDVRSIEHEEQEDVLLVFFNATTSTFDFLHNFGISKSIIKLFTNFQSIAASEDMAKEYAFVSLSAQESATHSGCDALVILPEQGNISHILLPNFDKQKAQHIRFEMGKYLRNKRMKVGRIERHAAVQEQGEEFEIVLAALWHDVVKPILDHLGYTKRISSNDLPHIAWCPTGALSFLPLHAAGDYDQPGSRVFDYVISSYTPNINAFLTPKPSTLSPESRMLAVGQANTLGQSSLPGTSIELDFIKAHSQGKVQYTQLTDAQATVTAVLDAMEYHDWVHLACYAHQDTQDPTQNGFFLHDGTLDLASINRRSPTSKGLAFLSACETAPGDEIPPDEAIHLASGMLMAGYSSVIGTMWPVVDEDAPFVADKVYGQLMQDGKVGNGEAGKALHSAVAALRERVGEKSFGRWMPYIHIGS